MTQLPDALPDLRGDLSSDVWPDPENAGAPTRPGRVGPHILLIVAHPDAPEVARWSAAEREWWLPGASLPKSAEWAAKFCRYLSPIHTAAELRACYEQGVAAGRQTAMALIEQAKAQAVQDALRPHQSALRQAERAGALAMRTRAAEIAMTPDANLLSGQLHAFGDNMQAGWHRRIHAEAIEAIPLPGDP